MSPEIYYDGRNKPLAQKLRREMTRQERHLWYDFLKGYSLTFRRQKQFGIFIVDFYCAKARLVIELDGSQHYEDQGRQKDRARDDYLEGLGFHVLRISNADIDLHFEEICELIDREVSKRI